MKKISSARKTYTMKEAEKMLDAYIAFSAERLRKRLRAAWKKNAIAAVKKDGYVRI